MDGALELLQRLVDDVAGLGFVVAGHERVEQFHVGHRFVRRAERTRRRRRRSLASTGNSAPCNTFSTSRHGFRWKRETVEIRLTG